MKSDKEKGTILTLVPAGADSDLARDAAIAVRAGRQRMAEDAEREAQNSRGFLRLEEPVREVALMAQVVEEVMIKAEEDGEDEMSEHLNWAVMHL